MLTSKRDIYRLIEAQPTDPRQPQPEGLEVYTFLDRAVRDVLTEVNRAGRRARVRMPLRGAGLTLSHWLQDLHVTAALEPEQAARLRFTLEHRPLTGFERDPALRAIVAGLGRVRTEETAAALEAFLVDAGLLTAAPDERVTVQQLREGDLTLIAYEWLV